MNAIAVIDFETTGLSPDMGDRAIEVAVVIVTNGKIVDRYQSLMNTDTRIPAFIEKLTGISNAMMHKAPKAAKVMGELVEFIGVTPLVAHNASFDCKFLDSEWSRIGQKRRSEFACSMLLARRIYPSAPDHKLGTLIRHLKLPLAARHHRALADAEMTDHLWLRMASDIKQQYGLSDVQYELLRALQKMPQAKISSYIDRCSKRK